MKSDNRNYYVAIALSVLVVIAWNYFYAGPQMAKMRAQQAQTAAVTDAKNGTTPGAPNALPQPSVNAPPQGGVAPQTPQTTKDRKDALADSPRVQIATPKLIGSIALKGARIDDLVLLGHRETIA